MKRGDLKRLVGFKETKLLNFFSAAGINFQNIASNDALISDKINSLVSQAGWSLEFVVTSGVESDAGKPDGNGIVRHPPRFSSDMDRHPGMTENVWARLGSACPIFASAIARYGDWQVDC